MTIFQNKIFFQTKPFEQNMWKSKKKSKSRPSFQPCWNFSKIMHNNRFELIFFLHESHCISSIRINIFPTIFWTNAYYLQQNRLRQLQILNISYKYTKVFNFTYVYNNLVRFLFYFPFGRDKYKSWKSWRYPT